MTALLNGGGAGSYSFPKEQPLPPIGQSHLARSGGGGGVAATAISVTAETSAANNGFAESAVPTNDTSLLDDTSFSSKLTNVEAQRIMSVLQEAQRKVRLIGMIPEVIDRKVTAIFSQDTVAVISVSSVLS
jgi:hypothetical protein